MKLAAYIDPKAAIRDNGPRAGLVVADIDIGDLSDEQRSVLASLDCNRNADAFRGANIADCAVVYGYDRGLLDHDTLVEFLGAQIEARRAEASRHAANVAEAIESARASITRGEVPYVAYPEARAEVYGWPEYQRLKAETEAREAAEKAERAAAAKAEAEAEAAAKAAARAEREAWIRAHGSARLRRCLEEGIAHRGLYRDERLAAERPGWEWDTVGTNEQPINPPEEAFAMLDEARKTAPDAKMTLIKIEEATDDETGEVTREAYEGFAAVDDFLGRGIIYGQRIPRD